MIADVDSGGVYGALWHYSMLFALMGSTLLVFIYSWKKGLLGMCEEAKYQMLDEDDDGRRD